MRIRRRMAVISGGTAERHGGRSLHGIPKFHTPRIPYAERILATGREVLLVLNQVTSTRHEFVPPALPGDRSGSFRSPYGSHNLLGPNRLRHCRAAQGVTDCHSPSGFAMTMVIDGWCFFIGRAEFPKPRIPHVPNSIRRADTSDRSGGFARLPSSKTHQARICPGPSPVRRADTSDQSSGPNGVIRPPACQNELAPGPAGKNAPVSCETGAFGYLIS